MECSSCLCNVSSLLFVRVHVCAFYLLGSWAITTPSLSHLISTSKRTLTFHPLLTGLFSLLHVVTSVWLLSIWYMRSSPGVLGGLAMLCYAILASHHHSFLHAPVFRTITAQFLHNSSFSEGHTFQAASRQLFMSMTKGSQTFVGCIYCLSPDTMVYTLFSLFYGFSHILLRSEQKSTRDAVQAEQNYLQWNLLLMVRITCLCNEILCITTLQPPRVMWGIPWLAECLLCATLSN